MNVFLAAIHAFAPHFKVRGETLFLAQSHPFSRVEIDLRKVAAHKFPGPAALHLRLLRGRWRDYSLEGFRSSEIRDYMLYSVDGSMRTMIAAGR